MKTIKKTLVATAIASAALVNSASAANIFVVGGMPSDSFWSIVKKGVEDAGMVVEAQGGSVTWLGPQNYDNLGPDAAELIRQAIDQGADGIVASDWVPEAMDPAFKAAKAAGIELVVYNSGGLAKADEFGALNYVGSDDSLAGLAGGEYLAKAGKKHGICVNTLPGTATAEAFCGGFVKGMKDNGADATVLPLPSTAMGNVTAVAQAVKAHLLQHPEIDAAFAINNIDNTGIATGAMQAGKSGKVGICGINFDETVLNNIKAGKSTCAIDQQGYHQGYMAVSILNGYINYGLTIPTREILTGPGIVDAANIDATLAGAKAGVR